MAKTKVYGEYLKDSVVRFTAKAGENITKGQPVYISGISGELPVVSLADADDTAKMPAFGLAEATVLNTEELEVTSFGTLAGLDTSTPGYSLGDILYVNTTAGTLTNDPAGLEATKLQNIGIVQRVHASNGSIKVGGAGRTNAVPNLDDGDIFIGDSNNKAISDSFTNVLNTEAGINSSANATAITIDSSENLIMTAGGTIRSGGANDLILDAGESGTPDIYLQSGGATKVKIEGSNGNVGIGESNPDASLHITSNTPIISFDESDAGQEYRIGSFGGAFAVYDSTDSAYRLVVDGSGTLLVGKTEDGTSNAGHVFFGAGAAYHIRDGGFTNFFNRTSSDGEILRFAKDGTTVGSIGTSGGLLNIGSGDIGLLFVPSTDVIVPSNPTDTANGGKDAAIDLGNIYNRFKDLYLSGGAYLGGTGSANHLDDYEEGTWTPTIGAGTVGASSGTYTKVGRVVTVTYYILLSTLGGSTTPLQINGLPFTSGISGVTGSHSAGSILCRFFTKNQIVSYVPAGVTYIHFYNNSSSNWDQVTYGEVEATYDNDFEAHGTLQYIV